MLIGPVWLLSFEERATHSARELSRTFYGCWFLLSCNFPSAFSPFLLSHSPLSSPAHIASRRSYANCAQRLSPCSAFHPLSASHSQQHHQHHQHVQAAYGLGSRCASCAASSHHGRGASNPGAMGQDPGPGGPKGLQIHGKRRNVIHPPIFPLDLFQCTSQLAAPVSFAFSFASTIRPSFSAPLPFSFPLHLHRQSNDSSDLCTISFNQNPSSPKAFLIPSTQDERTYDLGSYCRPCSASSLHEGGASLSRTAQGCRRTYA